MRKSIPGSVFRRIFSVLGTCILALCISISMIPARYGISRAESSVIFVISPTVADAGTNVVVKYILYVDGQEVDPAEGGLVITDLDNKRLEAADFKVDTVQKTITISAAAIKPGYAYTITYTDNGGSGSQGKDSTADNSGGGSASEILRILGLTLELSNPSGTTGHINKVGLTVSENGYRITPEEERISVTDSYGRLVTDYTYDKDTRRITFPKDTHPGIYNIKYSSDPYSDEKTYNIYDTDQPSWYGGFTADSDNIPLSKAGTTISYPVYAFDTTGVISSTDGTGASRDVFDYKKLDGSVGITGSRNFRLTSSRIDMSSGMPYVHVVLADALASGDTATLYLKLYYENKELSAYGNYYLTMVLTASDGTLENPDNPVNPSNTSVGMVIDTSGIDVTAYAEGNNTPSASILRVVMETNGVKALSFTGSADNSSSVVVPYMIETGGEALYVTRIGKAAFRNNGSLKNIVLPSTVNRIGRGAFDKARGLKKVTMYVYDAKGYAVKKNSFRGLSSGVTAEIHCYDQGEFNRMVNKIRKAGGTNVRFVRKGLK